MTDQRITAVAADLRARYRDALRAGQGYSPAHRELLSEIQRAERGVRNTDTGYWIAEADEDAGRHAIVHLYRLESPKTPHTLSFLARTSKIR